MPHEYVNFQLPRTVAAEAKRRAGEHGCTLAALLRAALECFDPDEIPEHQAMLDAFAAEYPTNREQQIARWAAIETAVADAYAELAKRTGKRARPITLALLAAAVPDATQKQISRACANRKLALHR